MATFNAPDVLLPSAGLNLTDFIVKLKKGEMGFGFDTFGGQEYGTQVVIIGSIDEGGSCIRSPHGWGSDSYG